MDEEGETGNVRGGMKEILQQKYQYNLRIQVVCRKCGHSELARDQHE